MRKTDNAGASKHIHALDMNGLPGRMAYLPAPRGKTAEILMVYGQHSSLERWWGLLEQLNRYGTVTAPDLPGFGGMASFQTIGKRPSLDNFADYLAAFITFRYRRKQVVIVGLEFGFVVATRMLQRYPALNGRTRLMVNIAGFAHHDDIRLPPLQHWWRSRLNNLCAMRLPAAFVRYTYLNRRMLGAVLDHDDRILQVSDSAERRRLIDAEIKLWQQNDVGTYSRTMGDLLSLDNCRQPLTVPLWHLSLEGDQTVDQHRVEQHLRVAFKNVKLARINVNRLPITVTDEAGGASLIPAKLRRVLAKI